MLRPKSSPPSPPHRRIRSRSERRGALVGDRGRPADREFRRAARNLSQRARRRAAARRCRRCFASLFTDRAIHYRIDKGFDHFKVVAVRRRDEDGALGSGGERRDLHPRHRVADFATSCSSPAPTALAKTSCRARSTPTNSTSSSRPIGQGNRAVLRRALGAKEIKMVYVEARHARTTRNIPTAAEERSDSASPTTRC